ncbi:putative sugar transferase EpsL [Sulfurospirillum diekertiae]|uniref:Sugar transferase EpsL n=1 Tax=Sulfurospirillum diekertiae TaxID=1854492 RepID=A0A290HI93_9BACT|nr:sugar transferase [Sulfurospirillum diekertiae]ATB70951.1 putative sugar transferase EpsL [Sulfurospirillum diekertiae]
MKKYLVNTVLFLLDFIFIIAIYHLVAWIRNSITTYEIPPLSLKNQEDFMPVFILIALILVYEKLYKYRLDFWEETKLVFKALSLSFIIILSFIMLSRINTEYSRSFIVMYFCFMTLLFPIYKRYIKKFLFSFNCFKKKVKIVGNMEQKIIIEREFKNNWYLGLCCVTKKYEAIFIATKDMPINALNLYLDRYMKETKDLYILPYIAKVNLAEVNIMEYFNIRTSVIHIENELLKSCNIFLKEIFEKLLMFLVLPLVLILHGFIAFVIKRDSIGSIFFRQERLGKDGKIFTCFKYRTMYEDGDSILDKYLEVNPEEIEYFKRYHKYQNDPRITKIGKFLRQSSLDELPQIINVLKANMSLIGPRPYMVEEMDKIKENRNIIFMVKPGITGLWQVSGRNDLTFENRKELDIWYIQNWSLWMDFIVLLKTFKVVLSKKGAR